MTRKPKRIERLKRAKTKLAELLDRPDRVMVIRYSCGSFYDRPTGASPRITSIAIRNLEAAQVDSFSIHQIAERQGCALTDMEAHYNECERAMLEDFYIFVHNHPNVMWLHWRMRDANYGFQAI